MTQMGPTCNPYGFSHMGDGPLLQITYQSPFHYHYGTHIISHIIETNVSKSHVLPAYYQGNSCAFDSRLLDLKETADQQVSV